MASESDTVVGRMKHLLKAGDGADCHFLVGKDGTEKKELSAHKAILCSASDVFRAMFRFDAENAKNSKNASSEETFSRPVDVIDVEPVAFKAMLSFIYADDLSGMNGENITEVLYAAKKYVISPLIKACTDFPISMLHNVFLAFAQARILGEEDFSRRCMEHIEQNAGNLLQTEQFLQIDQHLLCEVLERDQLKISGGEIEIWNAALRWADAQCRQNCMECSAENRRAQLGPALYKIRFRLIPPEEFTTKIAASSMLNSDELVSVYTSYHTHPTALSLYPLRFPIERRVLPPVSTTSSGKLMLKIEQFSVFARQVIGCRPVLSSPVLRMAGFEWNILAFTRKVPYITKECLAIYLQRVPSAADDDHHDGTIEWRSVSVMATIRIVSQTAEDGTADYCMTRQFVFIKSNPEFAYNSLMDVEELMNSPKGLCTNDTVILCVDFTVEDDK